MVSRALKRFGNSKCLPLDKTLLEILGIDYENAQVVISIQGNKLIIEKETAEEEQTEFLLNNEQWQQFNKALETKPESLAKISKLLNEPGVFDE